jgi:hypothetical protein
VDLLTNLPLNTNKGVVYKIRLSTARLSTVNYSEGYSNRVNKIVAEKKTAHQITPLCFVFFVKNFTFNHRTRSLPQRVKFIDQHLLMDHGPVSMPFGKSMSFPVTGRRHTGF